MKHLQDIKLYMKTLMNSEQFHALIVQSPPGWAKSTTINECLSSLKVNWKSIGSYSTPLFFYNSICENPDKVLVLDDCAGLFDNLTAMSLLKAATWPIQGTGDRIISWGSMSEKVRKPFANFKGKLILLTNVMPKGSDSEAFLSRSMFYNIAFTRQNVAGMLTEAAKQKRFYSNTKVAKQVATFLVDNLDRRDYTRFNLRTLQQGYELARVEPKRWKAAFEQLLPRVEPNELVKQLAGTADSVEDQCRYFMNNTGLSRRTYFNYRTQHGLDGYVPRGRKPGQMKGKLRETA